MKISHLSLLAVVAVSALFMALPTQAQNLYTMPFGPGGTWNLYEVIGNGVGSADTFKNAWATEGTLDPLTNTYPAHLVSIHSEYENSYVSLLGGGGDILIGLTDREGVAPGAEESQTYAPNERTTGWAWTSGEAVTYLHWGDGEPNNWDQSNPPGAEDIAHIRSDGFWNDNGSGFLLDDPIAPTLQPGESPAEPAFTAKYVREYEFNSATPVAGAIIPTALPAGRLPGPSGDMGTWGYREVRDLGSPGNILVAGNYLASGGGTIFDGEVPVANHRDPNSGGPGFMAGDLNFLSNDHAGADADDDNIQAVYHGKIHIPVAGDYTFGVHSDDGFAARFLNGTNWTSVSGSGLIDPLDAATLTFPNGTSDSNTRGVINLPAGNHEFEIVFFENNGGAFWELYAAAGAYAEDTDTEDWRLVGYQKGANIVTPGVTGDGWMVQCTEAGGTTITNIAQAEAELAAENPTPVNADLINYGSGSAGRIGSDANFPNGSDGNSGEDFALFATATLDIPADGTYYLGFQGDDGGYLRVIGQTFTSLVENAAAAVIDEGGQRLFCDALTGNSSTVGEISLLAGQYEIEALFFERGGGDNFEVFAGVPNSPFAGSLFRLLSANGASVVVDHDGLQLVPEPSCALLISVALGGLLAVCRYRRR